jgi:hypothetical protein
MLSAHTTQCAAHLLGKRSLQSKLIDSEPLAESTRCVRGYFDVSGKRGSTFVDELQLTNKGPRDQAGRSDGNTRIKQCHPAYRIYTERCFLL